MELKMTIVERLKAQIAEHDVLIYMKGTPDAPKCGFSAQAVSVLKAMGQPFAFVDILADPEVRATLPQVSSWPTFPQIFVKGELIGGCDILLSLYESGELKALFNKKLG
jgi:monothiol glutaredoxin